MKKSDTGIWQLSWAKKKNEIEKKDFDTQRAQFCPGKYGLVQLSSAVAAGICWRATAADWAVSSKHSDQCAGTSDGVVIM